ncbi:amidohydrolase family protein, partial [Dehalococcoidia bacterium]|nr:amidohydrolase family protein [Dehalococcoidia bacterium]
FGSMELRQQLRDEVDAEATMDGKVMRRPRINWDVLSIHQVQRKENSSFEGLTVREIATKQGKHLADALLDLALAEDLKTVLLTRLQPESDWFDEAKGKVYRNPHCIPMTSDAGAHLGAECKAGEGTYFLRRWVLDKGIMSLEDGVKKLTSAPAKFLGLADRGTLRVGAAADIMVFDPATLNALEKQPVADFPGGLTRWIQKATGVHHVLVNGQPTIRDGAEVGDLPGKVLRSGDYR